MYNLMEEKWLSVLYRDGRPATLNLIEVMEQAHSLQLAYSNPMDRFSVFRFMLALAYWCDNGRGEDLGYMDSLPPPWLEYLTTHKEHFELLGPGKRFCQDVSAAYLRPVTDLLHEIPTGNNPWHFNHALNYVSGLCPSCCVLGLLRQPVFGTPGLLGPKRENLTAGINGTPPVYAVFWGDSLLETLKLNWNPQPEQGNPAWIDISPDPLQEPMPLLTGLTLLSRKTHLCEPVNVSGTCSACGLKSTILVHAMKLESKKNMANPSWTDPHVVYSENTGKAVSAQDPFKTKDILFNKPWQKTLAMYHGSHPDLPAAKLWILGFSSEQAKFKDVFEFSVNLPIKLSTDNLELAVGWKRALLNGSAYIGNQLRHKKMGEFAISVVSPTAERNIASHKDAIAAESVFSWADAQNAYRSLISKTSPSLAPGNFVRSVLARRRISAVTLKPLRLMPKTDKGAINEQ